MQNWKFRDVNENAVHGLCQSVGVSPLLARLLMIRGLSSPTAAQSFLDPFNHTLHTPDLFTESEQAVERILQAASKRERVVVHGDYDADGITATCIMLETLREMGIDADYYLPDRLVDGYGLQTATVPKLASEYQLMITVDCGTTSVEAVQLANQHGLDVIITDHHDPGEERPPAVAVLNPIRPNESYPNKDLSGAGVAWKLAHALRSAANLLHDEEFLLEVAVIGLVADVMPLTGENRAIVARALKRFSRTTRPGLLALMDIAKVTPSAMTATDIGFRLGPRINASGRIDHPKYALELLLAKTEEEAWGLAKHLNQLNSQRQSLVKKTVDEAVNTVFDRNLLSRSERMLFVAGKNWQRGILGIVAQKLMDRFSRPVFLLSIEEDDIAHGSARAFGNASLIPLLDHARPHSVSCGGHQQAAGMKVAAANLESFENALYEAARDHWDSIEPEPLWIDAQLPLEQVDVDCLNDIARLEPFGKGNEEPLLYTRGSLNGYGARIVGNNHLRLSLRHPRGVATAIGFGQGDKLEKLCNNEIEIAFHPRFNEYQGRKEIQLNMVDVRPCASAPVTVKSGVNGNAGTNGKPDNPLNRATLGVIYRVLETNFNEEGYLPRKDLFFLIQLKQKQKNDDAEQYKAITRDLFDHAIQIFSEIDLLTVETDRIVMKKTEVKKQLNDSPTYLRLQSQTEAGAVT